jgi:hypothetical protein
MPSPRRRTAAARIACGALAAALAAVAPATARAEDAAPAGPKWYERVEVHGLVDTSFSANLDQPQSQPNALRLFDAQNGFQLVFAKLTVSTAPAPVGFRLDLGLGTTAGILSGKAPAEASVGDTTVEQALVSLKLPGAVVVDAGRFVTSAGAEVIEAKDNWLYSRSILFNYAIPFTHVGVRAAAPIRGVEGLSVMGSLFNGWDNPPAKVGSRKAGGLALSYGGPSSTTATLNAIYGHVNQDAPDPRLLLDAVLGRAFGALSLNVNGDWARQAGRAYAGLALMAHYPFLSDHLRATVRGEVLRDRDGLALGVLGADYWEGTVGLSFPVATSAELRLEARHDRSSPKTFRGGTSGEQTTLQAAALGWF